MSDTLKVTPRLAGGLPEWQPGQQRLFNQMLDTIRAGYELCGFTPIDTPALELTEVLLAKGGGENDQAVFSVTGGEQLTLRFDLTVPLARYVAQYANKLAFPFRRHHEAKVWRAEKPQRGRFREFYQCDFDIIGAQSHWYDAEIPAVIDTVFQMLDVGGYLIKINNRKLLNGFLSSLNVDPTLFEEVLRQIDKMGKQDLAVISGALLNLGLDEGQITRLFGFVEITGSDSEIFEQLQALDIGDEQFQTGLTELQDVCQAVVKFGVSPDCYCVDLSIARGLGYYTGTVYETFLKGFESVGSVCSGGRFDNLASYYTDTELPGVGASIGLTRLFWQLLQAERLTVPTPTPSQVMVAIMGAETIPYALEIANTLRSQLINTEVYLDPKVNLGKQLRYASRQGIPLVIICGPDEMTTNCCTVRNLNSAKQETVSRNAIELVTYVNEQLGRPRLIRA